MVRLYFRIIDPLSLNKQGGDEGTRYRTGVYYEEESDRPILEREFLRVKRDLDVEDMPVELLHLTSFYPADEYHQDYLDKHPDGYCHLNPAHFRLARSRR